MSPPLLTGLLRDVSRSFYLTLRVLPRPIRPPIGVAYLLARAADTIADTAVVSVERRLEALTRFRARVAGRDRQPLDLGPLAQHQGLPAERQLFERLEEALNLLERCAPDDQQRVRTVLEIITGGQQLDLIRFAGASAAQPAALETEADLDDYTYRVAGCVGEFWTRTCRTHLFPQAPLDDAELLGQAVRFGKGLQWVNVLRDLPADLRQGRCYLPQDRLAALGLRPLDLLDPANEPRLRPFYDECLAVARRHLIAGWHYTNTLPRSQVRVRLACAWPILIGGATLARLAEGEVLRPDRRIKVSRAEVRRWIWRSLINYPWPGRWRRLFPGA